MARAFIASSVFPSSSTAASACGVAACVVAAARTGHHAFLDVALGFALIAFLATVCWASALRDGIAEEDRS